ncbi:MAG: aldo/keto reductase, partial [Planctomycetota bacterium]|nr:aldo/keto reductase [Planctomycetota bacterium]
MSLERVRLGRTGLMVARLAMGCIPIQRLTLADAADLLRRAVDAGVNFFDTAHVYGDSEEKLGHAFSGMPRDRLVIASKAMANTREKAMSQLEESLRRLKTDYIDLYQWH